MKSDCIPFALLPKSRPKPDINRCDFSAISNLNIYNMNQKQANYQQSKLDNRNQIYFIIASIVILVLIISGATSCISQKRVAKICETCPKITKDSIVYIETENIITKSGLLDSLLWFSTIDFKRFTDTIFKTDTLIQFKDKTWSFDLIKDHDKIKIIASHQADSIRELNKTVTDLKQSTKTIEKKIYTDKPIRDKWYKFYCRFTWISIAVILFALGLLIFWKWNSLKIKWLSFINRG